jgi:hypothetical protein
LWRQAPANIFNHPQLWPSHTSIRAIDADAGSAEDQAAIVKNFGGTNVTSAITSDLVLCLSSPRAASWIRKHAGPHDESLVPYAILLTIPIALVFWKEPAASPLKTVAAGTSVP